MGKSELGCGIIDKMRGGAHSSCAAEEVVVVNHGRCRRGEERSRNVAEEVVVVDSGHCEQGGDERTSPLHGGEHQLIQYVFF